MINNRPKTVSVNFVDTTNSKYNIKKYLIYSIIK